MSAPPPPGMPGTLAYTGGQTLPGEDASSPRDTASISRLFASAAQARRRDRSQPYTRPGDESGLFLTREQWERYDSWNELRDKMERKYGHLRSVAAMLNTARGIW